VLDLVDQGGVGPVGPTVVRSCRSQPRHAPPEVVGAVQAPQQRQPGGAHPVEQRGVEVFRDEPGPYALDWVRRGRASAIFSSESLEEDSEGEMIG
jgi:hypothetical protein